MNIDYLATIIKLRAILNLSQVALAELLGVSFISVNRWENGKYEQLDLLKKKSGWYASKITFKWR